MFDFIITETEKDLKAEKMDNSYLKTANELKLGEEEIESSEDEAVDGASSSSAQGTGSATQSASVGEELATLAENSSNIVQKKGKNGYYYQVTKNGKISYYMEGQNGTNAGKLLKFNPSTKKYEQTTETIDDIKKKAIEISENTADYSSAIDNASGIAARLSSRLCGRTDKQEQGGACL
jgi:hypothetical protein